MANSIIKEFREFFLRHTQVNGGSKSDKETYYPTQYSVNGKTVYNRFLQGDFPTGDIFSKLFNSLAFKLNPEDTADSVNQGLVRIATEAEVLARMDANQGTFTNVLQPHHLPLFVNQIASGDVVLDSFYTNGVRITTAKSTSNGKDQIKYLIESSNSVPIGGVLGWFNNSIVPHGFLSTRGQTISRIAYPELFAILGTTFGAGDGSTTFKLPTLSFVVSEVTYYDIIRYDDKHDVETGS